MEMRSDQMTDRAYYLRQPAPRARDAVAKLLPPPLIGAAASMMPVTERAFLQELIERTQHLIAAIAISLA